MQKARELIFNILDRILHILLKYQLHIFAHELFPETPASLRKPNGFFMKSFLAYILRGMATIIQLLLYVVTLPIFYKNTKIENLKFSYILLYLQKYLRYRNVQYLILKLLTNSFDL